MKKNSIYALMSAIALSGAIGFSSCSSSKDDVAEVNPGYDPATGDVPVQFVFNVSTSNSSSTRMSNTATQATGANFRGIDHCLIMSKAQETDGKYISTSTTMDRIYDLARVLNVDEISSTNSRRVLEMAFPLNTNTLMFYGKAIVGENPHSETSGLTVNDAFGHLKTDGGYTVVENLSTVQFVLAKRLEGANKNKYLQIQNLLAGILTIVMNTNLKGSNHVAIGATNYGFDIATDEYNEFSWADYARTGDGAGKSPALPKVESGLPISTTITPLEEKLANAYTAMTTIDAANGELRAGAGDAVENMIQDLWSVVNGVRCASPTGKEEAIAKYMAAKIHTRLSQYFDATVTNDGAPVTGVKFKDASAVISAYITDATAENISSLPTTDSFNLITNADVLGKFPYFFHLPAGSTHLVFSDNKFSYAQIYNTSGMTETGAMVSEFTVDSYYFPPELLYFGNSPIRVCDKEHLVSDYPNTVANWHDNTKWPTVDGKAWTSDSHVLSSTRSVAMMNDINYGTALLKTTVEYGTATLNDNNAAIHPGEEANIITVDGTSFQLVGVLVGGQSKTVGWDFLPIKTVTALEPRAEKWIYGYVYDCDIASSAIPASGPSDPNYTLVFDNYNAAKDNNAQDNVYICLEIKNNSGKDFYGLHGLIKNGEVFYLIGMLDPSRAGNYNAEEFPWPAHHPMPPFDGDGASKKIKRIFMQDYMTSVNFKIGENSLKYAYLTVPDLRSSSLTLGLAVDIKWTPGLDFTGENSIVIGGN